MTNEKAIELIREKCEEDNQPERLAAMYAMDDIIDADIDTWLNTDVSQYLAQFPDVARELADGLCNVSQSMYYYAKFYEILNSYDEALSER
jgi:hypothetical protein